MPKRTKRNAGHGIDVRLYRVTLPICNLCVRGIGEECHVPGCAFWMSRPPHLDETLIERMEQP